MAGQVFHSYSVGFGTLGGFIQSIVMVSSGTRAKWSLVVITGLGLGMSHLSLIKLFRKGDTSFTISTVADRLSHRATTMFTPSDFHRTSRYLFLGIEKGGV